MSLDSTESRGRADARIGRTIKRAASSLDDPTLAVRDIGAALGNGPWALVLVFASPRHDRDALAAALSATPPFSGAPVIGCTTSGEITPQGLESGAVLAIGLPARDFAAAVRPIGPLSRFTLGEGRAAASALQQDLAGRGRGWPGEVALLLSDGMAMKEDALVAAVAPVLGATPLVGGSAGDALDFGASHVLVDGRFRTDAAALALVRARGPLRAFRSDHFRPSGLRMVVTGARPEERLVTELNAEPAAEEYARLLGRAPEDLTPGDFAANPLLVRMGGEHHVRSIQRAEPGGGLRFFSAVDHGMVLAAAERGDLAEHLETVLAGLEGAARPDTVLAFDCVLRRLEIEEAGAVAEVSALMRAHGVVGFNTYGEQFNGLHVNQTFTGVAFYPPADDRETR